MKWWDDLWLKESFADFMGTLGAKEANNFNDAWVTFANNRKAWAYMQDQLPTTHPIVADIPTWKQHRRTSTALPTQRRIRAQAAGRLRRLRHLHRGSTRVLQALRVGQHLLNDFLQVLNEVSGRDMQAWANAWLQTSGVSALGTKRVYGEDGQLTDLILTQELPAQQPAGLGRPTWQSWKPSR